MLWDALAVTVVRYKCNPSAAGVQQELCSFSFTYLINFSVDCGKELLAITAGHQSTSVYSSMKKTFKFSVFRKDQALPNVLFSAAGVYP